LHRALEVALRLGLVQRNVADMVDPPRMAQHDMVTLSPEQARALLATAKGDRLEALYVLALSTGMRLGELLALKWNDVNLDVGTLQVRATVQHAAGGLVFSEPKTARSRRTVALPTTAVVALQGHRQRQLNQRRTIADAWTDLDLVFPNTIGRPIDGTNLLKYWFRATA
jgi:integrase